MSQKTSKSTFILSLKNIPQTLGVIPPESLPSKRDYKCANHDKREAFCMCAKCGLMLCEQCGIVVLGRRYCETCTIEDDGLRTAFEQEIFKPRQQEDEKRSMERVGKAPQNILELPSAILNMMFDSYHFFKIAKDSSFPLTFFMAFIALLPLSVYIYLVKLEEVLANIPEEFKDYATLLLSLSDAHLMGMAIIDALIRVFLFDLIFHSCIRLLSKSKLTFKQAGAVLHFCLLPLIFCVLAPIFEQPIIHMVAVCLMIIKTTTASRVATGCNFIQGLGIMLIFIVITTLLNLFGA